MKANDRAKVSLAAMRLRECGKVGIEMSLGVSLRAKICELRKMNQKAESEEWRRIEKREKRAKFTGTDSTRSAAASQRRDSIGCQEQRIGSVKFEGAALSQKTGEFRGLEMIQ